MLLIETVFKKNWKVIVVEDPKKTPEHNPKKRWRTFLHFSQISKSVNKYSVKHQQDLTLSTLEHKTLTEPTYVHSFDFRDYYPTSNAIQTKSAFAKLTDAGIVHAVVYWYA